MKAGIIFLICAQMACINQLMAQQEPDNFLQSPEVAAFNKYFDFPVSYYTGMANMSIPLYNISFEGTSVPISISYHPSGIRVNEESTWVGLGWSLEAGGQISKTTRGKDDFSGNGYLNVNSTFPDYDQFSQVYYSPYYDERHMEISEDNHSHHLDPLLLEDSYLYNMMFMGQQKDYYWELSAGRYDYESDLYNLSIPGYSAQFFFDKNLDVQFVDKQDLLITLTQEPERNFVVQTPDGLIYRFEEIVEYISNGVNYPSSWLLTSISNPQQSKSITFRYTDQKAFLQYGYYNHKKYTLKTLSGDNYGDCPGEIVQNPLQQYLCYERYLKRIEFENGKVCFWPDTLSTDAREDLYGALRLEKVQVYNQNDEKIKSFSFHQSYFTKNSSDVGYQNYISDPHFSQKRMRLDSMTEEGKPPFKFDYETKEIMPKTTYSQDFWGYYNGSPNGSLVPSYIYSGYKYPGGEADRFPNGDFTKAGLLNKITYPTGGVTIFEYEANKMLEKVMKQDEIKVTFNEGLQYGMSNAILNVEGNPGPINIDPYIFIKDFNNKLGFNPDIPISVAIIKILDSEEDTKQICFLDIYGGEYEIDNLHYDHFYISNSPSHDALSLSIGKYLITRDTSIIKDYYGTVPQGFSHSIPDDSFFSVNLSYFRDIDTNEEIDGPGMRIKQIVSKDNISKKTVVKSYEYKNSLLLTKPLFYQTPYFTRIDQHCYGLYIYSSNVNHLSTSGGSYVGYGEVIEYSEDNFNNARFKNVYTFHNKISYSCPMSNGNKLPSLDDPLNGKMKSSCYYTYRNNEWKPVKLTLNYFNVADNEVFPMLNCYVRPEPDPTSPNQDATHLIAYGMHSNFIKLDSVIDITYGSHDEETFVVKTENKYNNDKGYYNLRESLTSRSDGVKLRNATLYPFDYDNVGFTDDMMNAYMIGMPVESYTVSDEGKVLAGSFIKYKTDGRAGLVDEVYKLKQEDLTLDTEFIPSNNVTGLINDYYERQAVYDVYDNGKLVQLHKENDINVTYLWGYNQSLPVAKIENANEAEVIAALGSIGSSKADIESKSLMVADEFQLIVLFNSLRQVPSMSKAIITTYTHDPLRGITSTTDPNGITTYYEYDNLGRLEIIREHDFDMDNDHNILNKYDYKYHE